MPKKINVFFSVVIPALNEEKYLPNLLADLAFQTYSDFEVIVVDGNSEDKTVEESSKFKSKFKKFTILQSDRRNVSYQRNLGAKSAIGRWIIFMDADNRLPDYFLDGIRYQIAKTKCDIFTTYCEPDTDSAGDKLVTQSINAALEIAQFLEKPSAQGAMIGVTTEGFYKIEGFDTEFIPSEDKMFVRTAIKKGLEFVIFKEPRYIFSMRRYKKAGHLKTITNYLDINFQDEMSGGKRKAVKYEMGGHLFNQDKKLETEDFKRLFKEISNQKTLKGKVEILLKFIKHNQSL
ncbi:MAG: glycosyltransferase family 2 protein [Patescibacteria group bacterium]|nr:glycosyltransferase family 2 protein [Patescibacteria group bacterium]